MSFGGFVGALGDAFMGQAQQDKDNERRKFLYDQLNETIQSRRDIASENNASREERTNTSAAVRRDAITQGGLNRQAILDAARVTAEARAKERATEGIFPTRDKNGVNRVLNRSGKDAVTGESVTSALPGSGRAATDPAIRQLQAAANNAKQMASLSQSRINNIIAQAKNTGIFLDGPAPEITDFKKYHAYTQAMIGLQKENAIYAGHVARAQDFSGKLQDHVANAMAGLQDTPTPEQPQQMAPAQVDPTQDAGADPNFAAWMARQP